MIDPSEVVTRRFRRRNVLASMLERFRATGRGTANMVAARHRQGPLASAGCSQIEAHDAFVHLWAAECLGAANAAAPRRHLQGATFGGLVQAAVAHGPYGPQAPRSGGLLVDLSAAEAPSGLLCSPPANPIPTRRRTHTHTHTHTHKRHGDSRLLPAPLSLFCSLRRALLAATLGDSSRLPHG